MMPRLAPWLEPAFQQATAALAAARLPHGIVLHAAAGWGVEHLARALALRLLDVADNGRDVATFAHPDLRWIVPEGKGEQIKIESIRSLAEFAVRTPQMGSRKVAVLLHADAMNDHAANALLKTLEEPPAGTHLLLVTSALADLLPTIRSRCQRFAVKVGSHDDALRWVREQIQVTDDDLLELVAFELSFAPETVAAALREGLPPAASVLRDALCAEDSVVRLAERAAHFHPDDFVARAMRHIAGSLPGAPASTRVNGVLADNLAQTSAERRHALWDSHMTARALLRGTSNPNPKLLLEHLLSQWRALSAPV
jgi:DNA polymerase-3 subunit delta'